MSKLVTVTLVVLAVVGVAAGATWLVLSLTSGPKCDGPLDATPTGNAAGPTAAAPSGEEYWTDERMSNARGVEMTVQQHC